MNSNEKICFKCHGDGYQKDHPDEGVCPICKGSGVTTKNEKPLDTELPKRDPIMDYIEKHIPKVIK